MKGIISDWMGTLYKRNEGLFPFTIPVLKALKPKYKLGLISLGKEGIEQRRAEIEATGIIPYFNHIIIDTTKTREIYLRCMLEMGLVIKDTAIVDDRMLRGIMIGNQLGCETYWIQKGDFAHELPNAETGEPTHKIDSIEDLLRYL